MDCGYPTNPSRELPKNRFSGKKFEIIIYQFNYAILCQFNGIKIDINNN